MLGKYHRYRNLFWHIWVEIHMNIVNFMTKSVLFELLWMYYCIAETITMLLFIEMINRITTLYVKIHQQKLLHSLQERFVLKLNDESHKSIFKITLESPWILLVPTNSHGKYRPVKTCGRWVCKCSKTRILFWLLSN